MVSTAAVVDSVVAAGAAVSVVFAAFPHPTMLAAKSIAAPIVAVTLQVVFFII